MTKEEYDFKKDALLAIYELGKKELRKEYSFSNNPHSIGDIISDHVGSIKIQSIAFGTSFNSKYPECFYSGIELKKDGKPAKVQKHTTIWQSNIKP